MSVDRRGAQIFLSPDELTKLFCFQNVWNQSSSTSQRAKLSKHQTLDALLSEKHKEAIADYIDQQIVKSEYGESSKLEQLLKQSALNIEYGMSSFHKHRLFEVNPKVKEKVERQEKAQQKQLTHGFDAGFRTAQFAQDVGISVPHFNTALESRAKVEQA